VQHGTASDLGSKGKYATNCCTFFPPRLLAASASVYVFFVELASCFERLFGTGKP